MATDGRLRALRVQAGGEGWEELGHLLDCFARALDRRARGRVDAAVLLDWVARGEATAYILRRGDRPLGLLVVRVVTRGEPAPTLWVNAVYRTPGETRALSWLYRLARLEMRRRGLHRLAAESPWPGLWRLLRRYGFRPRAVSFLWEG